MYNSEASDYEPVPKTLGYNIYNFYVDGTVGGGCSGWVMEFGPQRSCNRVLTPKTDNVTVGSVHGPV